MNDSSTAGYLTPVKVLQVLQGPQAWSDGFSSAFNPQPLPAPAPVEDQELYEVLQAAVVGITGLSGDLVRPRWQAEPSLIPTAGTCWCALGVTERDADTYPFVGMLADGSYQMQRHETFVMLATFYDLGYSGQADYFAALLRDGLMVPQNLEALAANAIYMVSDADLVTEPVLFKTRWMYRVDLRVRMRRQVTRDYPVLAVESVGVGLYTDDGQPPRNIEVQ